ncbi:MAG: 1-(5-phosphoribosyl)-5-[(5-phosphoribosylamino)methylideneamino] imidazole-4-carboxamide isomerase [Gemmatimonadota bacterium]|nr:1-(5-phosphoribosyl)-5-[(5-phosphoribosylamino)methylideneamino] imidazole-4-carboxamide isomerase [Gemmatimonadota bacterium]
MQVIPAIDLRDGACVQLVGGSYADERVRIQNPAAVAENWARLGFGRIHLVDLDAATGCGSNRKIVRAILIADGTKIQCGGGVRDFDTIGELLAAGASEVVLGTRAIEDRAWLEGVVRAYPNRIIVAADTKGRQLVTRGWLKTESRNVIDFIDELGSLKLAAVLVTAVEREGRMEGPDLSLMGDLALRSKLPIQASGGISSLDDIRRLDELGVHAAIVGMALYTGALDPETIIEDFV